MTPSATASSAIAIRGKRIAAVGSDGQIAGWIGSDTKVVDLNGRTVLPGLADVHTHVAANAKDPNTAECRDFYTPVASIAEILEKLAERAAAAEADQWVLGVGSPSQDLRLREGRLPTRSELDQAADGRPGYITFGPHLLVANTAALHAAGVDAATPDPQGGEIVRGSDGEPTGVLREVAQDLVRLKRPRSSVSLEDRISYELLACARRGVTTVHDVVTSPDEVRAYQRLEREGRLPCRVHLLFRVFQSRFSTYDLLSLGLGVGFGTDRLRIGGVKVSVDGGDDKRTGFYPQTGDAERGFSPLLRMEQTDLDPIIDRYHSSGMRIWVHAVGDLALDMTLRGFERALSGRPRPDHRHRIEHMGNFMSTAKAVEQAAQLGLIPVPNPTSLHYMGSVAEHALGPERTVDAFPFRRLSTSGVPFAIASDGPGLWPIDPLRDASICATRTTIDGMVISPDEAISVEDALIAQTRTAAWLGFVEDDLGTLEPGRFADLVVLARDPLTVEPTEVAAMPVDLTILDGEVTFERYEDA